MQYHEFWKYPKFKNYLMLRRSSESYSWYIQYVLMFWDYTIKVNTWYKKIVGERKDHHLTPQHPKKQVNYLLEAHEFQFIKRNHTNIPKTLQSYSTDNGYVGKHSWLDADISSVEISYHKKKQIRLLFDLLIKTGKYDSLRVDKTTYLAPWLFKSPAQIHIWVFFVQWKM